MPGLLTLRRPDGRTFVLPDAATSADRIALLRSAVSSSAVPLFTEAEEEDNAAALSAAGFVPVRRERRVLIPTDRRITGLDDVAWPAGYDLVGAEDVPEAELRLLDDELRQDVPGTDGWRWDEAGFHRETFGSQFDPATYLVARTLAGAEPAALIRVWRMADRRRLGLVGVRRAHRRRGLARALVAEVFSRLHAQGVGEVHAEIDLTNRASAALFDAVGARTVGVTIELRAEPGSASTPAGGAGR